MFQTAIVVFGVMDAFLESNQEEGSFCGLPCFSNAVDFDDFDGDNVEGAHPPSSDFVTCDQPMGDFPSGCNVPGYTAAIDRNSPCFKHRILQGIDVKRAGDPECAICLEILDPDEDRVDNDIVMLACNHRFHRRCLGQWLESRATCPMCREIQHSQVRRDIAPTCRNLVAYAGPSSRDTESLATMMLREADQPYLYPSGSLRVGIVESWMF
eukprot:jgi/Bigna1/140758/aug1.58_g15466